MRGRIVTGTFVLLLLSGLACGRADGYDRAVAIERELLRGRPDAGYDDPRYVTVMKELRSVPFGHRKKAEAQEAFQRISDGRRLLVAERVPGAGHLPKRLRGRTPEKPGERGFSPAPPPPELPAGEGAPTAATGDRVILYSTSWCGYCRQARDFFRRRGVDFVEKDIEQDAAAHAEYRGKAGGYGGVPLIDVGGTVIRGFDQRAVERALDATAR